MERREYQRINISAEGAFVFLNTDSTYRECQGLIEDISENGIKILLSNSLSDKSLPSISDDASLHFQAVDNYDLYGNKKTALIMGKAKVVRQELQDDFIVLGCRVSEYTSELVNYNYVSERKLSHYINSLE